MTIWRLFWLSILWIIHGLWVAIKCAIAVAICTIEWIIGGLWAIIVIIDVICTYRTDGPAIELVDGTKIWHLNGKIHRTDGPAVEWSDGTKEWYLNGVELTEEQFKLQGEIKC